MLTIECGIGTIQYQKPEVLKLEHLMEAVKDTVELSTPDEVIVYLDEFKNKKVGVEEEDTSELEDEIEELEEQVEELEAALEKQGNIDCGIGTIEYTADNLLLEQLMEELTNAIQSSTPLEVMRMMEEFNKEKLAS